MGNDPLKAEVTKRLGKLAVAHLATCDRGQPRVRPVTLISRGGKIWLATNSNSAKARQARVNPRVEACVHFREKKRSGYVRITARMEEVRKVSERRAIGRYCGYIETYWKDVDDADYALFRIVPTGVTYMRPSAMIAVNVNW